MAASVACVFFFDAEPVGEPGVHALDACALCTKPLARDNDIFMYRGDTPFCSDEQAARAAARRQKQFSSATGGVPLFKKNELTGESGRLGMYLRKQDLRARSHRRPWPNDQREIEETRLG
ncbi:hypothetical protein VPH35_039751 [Triticum aestivum]